MDGPVGRTAKAEFGKDLHIAALAVVLEPEKIRVVHDGTNKIHINNCIRVRDRVMSPTPGELRALMREKYEKKNRCKQFILVGDVSLAHRRVKVRRDWAFQACRLEPSSIWLNAVGTYGASSAGYWWSKLSSALLVRLLHYILSPAGDQDVPLYADDIFCIAGNKQEIEDLGAMLLIWMALGTPWKWRKFRGGFACSGVGYWVDFDRYQLGLEVKGRLDPWLGRADAGEGLRGNGRLQGCAGTHGFYGWCVGVPEAFPVSLVRVGGTASEKCLFRGRWRSCYGTSRRSSTQRGDVWT